MHLSIFELVALLISALAIGFALGSYLMAKRVRNRKCDGVLDVVEGDEKLLLQVEFVTEPEDLKEQRVAVFHIRKVKAKQ